MALWQGLVATTISKYLKGEQNSILRKRRLLARLESEGRLKFGESGVNLVFPVEYRRNTLKTMSDMQTLNYGRFNRHKRGTIEWIGLVIDESYSELDTLINKGEQALVKLVGDKARKIASDIREGFGTELYLDGNDPANAGHLGGIKTMLGASATLGDGSNGFAKGVYQAEDTYAGLSTKQNDHGGTWTGQWPSGDGSVEYDFWSPLIVKYTDTAFDPTGTSTVLWTTNAEKAMRFAIAHGQRNKARMGSTNLFTMPVDMFSQFQQLFASKERWLMEDGTRKLVAGFGPEMEFDGVEVTPDMGVPSGEVYGLNTDSMAIHCLYDQLFKGQEPDWNSSDSSWRIAAKFWGNVAFYSPRDFVQLRA